MQTRRLVPVESKWVRTGRNNTLLSPCRMMVFNLHGELGRHLIIEVHGYEFTAPRDPYDANWLRCTVKAKMGAFYGEGDASFTVQDFARFSSELAPLVNGGARQASFQTMEGALALQIELDRAGHAKTKGTLREIEVDGASLSFVMEGDWSSLARAKSELDEIVKFFPDRALSG